MEGGMNATQCTTYLKGRSSDKHSKNCSFQEGGDIMNFHFSIYLTKCIIFI